MRAKPKSDLKRIDAMKDSDIDYSDIPEIDDEMFARAVVKEPAKATITIRVDQDVLDWFKDQGAGYKTRINGVLRGYRDQVVIAQLDTETGMQARPMKKRRKVKR